jgi:signal transduction histidine kinase
VIFHFQGAIEEFEKKLEMRTRQLEEHVDELNQTKTLVQRLENDLESSGRELEMVNRKLKETDVTKLIFIGIASHELKTPLTAIKANIDFILSEKEGKLPEHLKSYLLTIQRNTNRIKMRMDHMLDLTRIRSGRLHLYREPIYLSQVVGGYVNEVKPENKRLLFKVEVPDHLVVIDKQPRYVSTSLLCQIHTGRRRD